MNRQFFVLRCAAAACSLAGVVACSGAPSEDQMKQALQRQTSGLLANLPSDMKPEIKSVHKIGCERSGSAYLCDVEVEAGLKGSASQKTTSRLRFIEGKDGWSASQ